MFFHGPGGSGKTYMLTQVVLPVYEAYLPSCARGVAAQNSAARLIRGCTFHYLAGLTRNQALAIKKPTKQRLAALLRRWQRLVLLFMDEISLTPPPLLAVLNASAGWGRQEIAALKDVADFQERPLGHVRRFPAAQSGTQPLTNGGMASSQNMISTGQSSAFMTWTHVKLYIFGCGVGTAF